jgi:gliding motility-associated-like protein
MRRELLLLAGLLPALLVAQNLVPNPSFELYEACPPYLGQIHLASGWDSPNYATSDFFNGCADSASGVSVPQNRLGWQEGLEGTGYAGLRSWLPPGSQLPNQREYLSVALSRPLEADSLYAIGFYVSLAERATHSASDIGLRLSAQPFQAQPSYLLPYHLRCPAADIPLDPLRWQHIAGSYRASGGERYLMIGNFTPDDSMQLLTLPPNPQRDVLSVYFYIESVYVQPLRDCAGIRPDLGPDRLICPGECLRIGAEIEGAAYRWSNGDSLPYQIASAPGVYALSVSRGGCSGADTLVLRAGSLPGPFRATYDSSLCAGEPWRFEGLPGARAYRWQDGDSSAARMLSGPGEWQLTSLFDCDSAQQRIRVRAADCECSYAAPDVFTPNGDGVNESFRIRLGGLVRGYRLTIYDRWGRQVFFSERPGQPWTGEGQEAGTYFWHLSYECREPGGFGLRHLGGHVSLLR